MLTKTKIGFLTLATLCSVSAFAQMQANEAAFQFIFLDERGEFIDNYYGTVDFCNVDITPRPICASIDFSGDEVVIFPVPGLDGAKNSSGWNLVADGFKAAFSGFKNETDPALWDNHTITPQFDRVGECEIFSGAVSYEINGEPVGNSTSTIIFVAKTVLNKNGSTRINEIVCENSEDFITPVL